MPACKHVCMRACVHCTCMSMFTHVAHAIYRELKQCKAWHALFLCMSKNSRKIGWRKPPFACACETHDHATTWTFRLTERSCNACENDKTVCKTSTKQYYFMRMPPNMSYHAMAWNYHAARLDSHVVQHIYDRCNNLQFMLISWLR